MFLKHFLRRPSHIGVGFLLGLALFLGCPAALYAQGLVPDSTELRVLRQFYYATNGPKWSHQHKWLVGTTLADVAGWVGVQTNGKDVTHLVLPENNIVGTLPACLGLLRGLEWLRISQNDQLRGKLPSEWSNLDHLQGLELQKNSLTGYIPTEWAHLRQLRHLNLYSNVLSGEVPVELGRLTQLNYLNLGANKFKGAIPDSLARLRRLRTLDLAVNSLKGPLPLALGDLDSLETIELGRNSFQDSIPAAWKGMRRLRTLNIYQARIIGRLPHELGLLKELQVLGFRSNELQGTVPAEIGQLNQLRILDLSYNKLSGSLPSELCSLSSLWKLSVEFNRFTGPLPASLGKLRRMQELRLNNNQFSGTLPSSLGKLSALRVFWASDNFLSGILPDSLTHCTALLDLRLPRNRLSGSLPANLNSWAELGYLDLGDNQLSGPLPVGLTQLSRLSYCMLNHNRLVGALPADWSQLTGMSYLDLSDNRLAGMVPAALLRLPATVQLQNNRFTSVEQTTEATLPVRLNLSGNYLDFGALEALATGPGQPKPVALDVHFQQSITPADTQYVAQGTQPWVAQRVGGTHNHYQWQRCIGGQLWVPLFGVMSTENEGPETAEADSIRLNRMVEGMEGGYRVLVTHDWFPGTVLYSRGRYLSLLPYTVPARNEPINSSLPTLVDAAPTDRTGAEDLVNYVRTYTARTPQTDPAQLRAAPVQNVQISTSYLDGLGRPVQTVQHQASPSGYDVVQPQAYDALNRQPRQYLPYTAAPAAGNPLAAYRPNALREQYNFYRTPTAAGIPTTGVAYAETGFEASPLNQALAQASPGETWMLHAADNHAVHMVERTNTTDQDTVRCWVPGYGIDRENLTLAGIYAPGALWVQQTIDEQGQTSRTYTDQEGHVVLKQNSLGKINDYTVVHGIDTLRYERRNWLSTYYLYDEFGRLRAVIPPLAEQRLRAHQWVVDGAGLERLLFRYHYDDQGRMIEKKVPDQDGYAYIVYDELDRPILTQDVSQRTRAEWTATKYDESGRVVLTALVQRPNQTRQQLQAVATAATVLWEQPTTTAGPGGVYYTNHAWPTLAATDQVLSTIEYDSYDFDHNGTADAQYLSSYDTQLGAGTPAVADLRTTGQATRTRTRVLGVAESASGAWLSSISFTDEQLRPIQLQSTNARGSQDVVTTRFDFAGKPLVTVASHNGPNHTPITVRETFSYDPTGRLLETIQELDGHAPVTIAANNYNELGQLQQKKLGSSKQLSALQTVDYTYNIRGWLTRVNDAQLTPEPDQRPDLFGLELSYDQGFNTNQFNGNIAGQKWRTASDNVERAYGYRYDQLSRLLQGDFVARDAAGTWNAERDNYRFWAASYDANGNLLTMRRRGLVQEASRTTPRRYGEIDDLRYRYLPDATNPGAASNRLLRVDDLAPQPSVFGTMQPTRPDFQDGNTTGSQQPDYAYDEAGSLIRDRNKDIDSIIYNHLHLPTRIVWNNGNRLEFRYTAAGQKVAKLATPVGKPTVRTDYLGAWQYEGDSLRWLNTSEGRALRFVQRDAAGQPITRYSYEYTIKDHLGNLRVAFRPGDRARHRATMEPALADQEESQFDYVRETRFATTAAAAGQYVSRLNAAAGKPIGPLKTLSVRKGDTLQIEAFGRYQQPVQNPNYVFSMLGFVASMLQQPATPPSPGDGRNTRLGSLPFLGIGLAVVPQLLQLGNGVPRAYLRALVFDKDSTLLTSYTQQLTMSAQNDYERLSINLTAPQDGFVQTYVGNESDTDVYFDDISIWYQPTLVVQENQYDPFGLDLVGLSKNASNRCLYNSTELQSEFGLSWNHYGARMYDAQIGQWATIDPMAESYFSFSPYNYVRNNPILRIDPTGQWDITVHTYKDRSTYGYGIAVVTDCNGKEVYRFNVRVEGAGGHNRNKKNSDTPTGVYDIPDKNMWLEVTQGGYIKNGKGTPDELRKNREAYGPNPRLILSPQSGEIVDTGRDDIRVHGGRQEKRDTKTGEWVPVAKPQLVITNGCNRAFDADMVQLKTITDNLQKNNPDEKGGSLKVVDDLEPHYKQNSTAEGTSSWSILYMIPGDYSANKNPEQFQQLLKDLFPNWGKK